MCKTLWDEELTMIIFHIEHSTFYAMYQFTRSIRWTLEVQASHDTIVAHTLIILAEVNTMPQDRSNLFFKLSLAETLEEVATSITEETWLYNENAIYFCLYYIHRFNFCSYIRFFRITPPLFSQRGLHRFPQAPFPSGDRGCSWRRYSSARVLVSSAEPVPQGAADDCLRNSIAIVCRLAH